MGIQPCYSTDERLHHPAVADVPSGGKAVVDQWYLEPEVWGDWTEPSIDTPCPTNFGISCGNWGAHDSGSQKHRYMLKDINESPGAVF